MAKVSFSKLNLKPKYDEAVPVQIGEQTIAVKQYLPTQEKLELIGKVAEYAHEEDYYFANPVKADIMTILEMIFAYTDISFTDKQKEDVPKLYDTLYTNGVIGEVVKAIPDKEVNTIITGVHDTLEAWYKYQNSVLGVLNTVKQDYNDTDFDITHLQEALSNGENIEFVKELMSKLG